MPTTFSIISQGSTASSLAIAGDNIFRFCPNDKREADAIVALMQHDGIHSIVPLWRNNAGNNGLHDSVKAVFENVGGTVTSGFQYQPTTTDFSAATTSVASQVQSLVTAGADRTVSRFTSRPSMKRSMSSIARRLTLLLFTRWYGSDGVALSAALTGDASAAAFAASAYYPNPTFGLDDALQNLWQPVADAIEARTGIPADHRAFRCTTSLFVVERALRVTGNLKDFASFKSAFADAANNYSGVTGSTALDAAGDRLSADFDFWAVRQVSGTFSWIRIGAYTNGTITLF